MCGCTFHLNNANVSVTNKKMTGTNATAIVGFLGCFTAPLLSLMKKILLLRSNLDQTKILLTYFLGPTDN